EVNVASNPLQCDCSLWEWVSWADKRSVVDPSTLPCNETVAEMRLYSSEKKSCGPMVDGHSEVERVELAQGQSTVICCTVSALPVAAVHWIHGGIVLGQTEATTISDGARVRHCIDVQEGNGDAYGEYQCVASASGRNASKSFFIDTPRRMLPPKPPHSLLFYGQFSLVIFLFVFCFASYCIIRRDKSRTKTDDLCRSGGHVIPILVDDGYDKSMHDFRMQKESPRSGLYVGHQDEEWLAHTAV
ncbi:unnamed protein product, partial [Mesorhabditis spiculigera]